MSERLGVHAPVIEPGVRVTAGVTPEDRPRPYVLYVGALDAGAAARVLPSRLEGYGLPPREAAAHGVPSIVSDLPALRMPGTLRVPPGDAAALAQALTSLPAERARLVAELAPPRSWETAAAELDAVLAEAAG